MSNANPVSDIDIILSVFPMDKAVLESLDKATFDGLLKTARKDLEKKAEGEVLTPILNAMKAAKVQIPVGFNVNIQQDDKGDFTVSLRKRSTGGTGSSGRGKPVKFTKYPKDLKSALAGKVFKSGMDALKAVNAENPEKYPMPDPSKSYSAPQKLRSFGFEIEYLPKPEKSEDTADKQVTRKRTRRNRR